MRKISLKRTSFSILLFYFYNIFIILIFGCQQMRHGEKGAAVKDSSSFSENQIFPLFFKNVFFMFLNLVMIAILAEYKIK